MENTGAKITRRDLFLNRRSQTGVAPRLSEAEKSGLEIQGPIKIGNLDLSLLPTEHRERDWKEHGSQITQIIKDYPLVIPEYFLPEYVPTEGEFNPAMKTVVDLYKPMNYLFDELTKVLHKDKKNVWVLDPSYTLEFMFPQYAMPALSGFTLLGMGAAAWLVVHEHFENTLHKLKHSRRQFMSQAATTAVVALTGLLELNNVQLATDFRSTVIAENLNHLGKILPPETKGILIYPKAHVESILGNLKDPDTRRLKLGIYSKTMPFRKLFLGRNYMATDSGWERTQTISAA